MYKKAEEGMISEGRDANLNLRAVWKTNQSEPINNQAAEEFLFIIGLFVPGKI